MNHTTPKNLRGGTNAVELISIADSDLMLGTWRLGTIDPRSTINELRELHVRIASEGAVGATTGQRDLQLDLTNRLMEQIVASAVIGSLDSNSNSLRYLFAMIEKNEAEQGKDQKLEPAPYFINALQVLLLAAKPQHRKDLMGAVLDATGLPGAIL